MSSIDSIQVCCRCKAKPRHVTRTGNIRSFCRECEYFARKNRPRKIYSDYELKRKNSSRRKEYISLWKKAHKKEKQRLCIRCGTQIEKPNLVCNTCKELVRKATAERKRKKEKELYYRKRIRVNISLTCDECGEEFTVSHRIKTKFCSKKCQRKAHKKTARYVRKVKMKLKKDHGITLFKVLKRSNFICGICGESINTNIESNSINGASIDHIIPLAKGGTHTWDNVQAAHRLCNSKKRDLLVEKRVA